MQRSTSAFLPSLFVQSSRLLQSTRARLDNGMQIRASMIDLLYASKIRLYIQVHNVRYSDSMRAKRRVILA